MKNSLKLLNIRWILPFNGSCIVGFGFI